MKLSDTFCDSCGTRMLSVGEYFYCQKCKIGGLMPSGIPEGINEDTEYNTDEEDKKLRRLLGEAAYHANFSAPGMIY